MYCGDSRHFAVAYPRKLKAVSDQVEVNPFKENQEKNNEGKGKEVESKSLDQYNKDGHCTGHKSLLSIFVSPSFDISQFSNNSVELKESVIESKYLVVKYLLKIKDRAI